MSKILNPRVDFVFKKLFGTESNKDLLMGLLNAILLPEDQVSDITLKNPYTIKNLALDKLSIFDIRAINKKGIQFSIEMQISSELSYEKRALFLWSKLYSEQLEEGMDYGDLKRSISIHLLNFDMMDEPDYHNVYGIKNLKTHKPALQDLQIHTIELKKFEETHPTGKSITTALDRWSTFLTRTESLMKGNMPPGLTNDPLIHKALEVLKTTALSEQEQEIYRTHWQWLMTEKSAIQFAKIEGLQEGEAIGIEKGKLKKSIEIAKALKNENLSIEQISKITGLVTNEIQKL